MRDADRAKDIVGRIRDHIKKAPPRNDRFDLNELINEVIGMVQSSIDRNGVLGPNPLQGWIDFTFGVIVFNFNKSS